MDKSNMAWIDGKYVDAKKAHISAFTYSFHYGIAAFEGIRFYSSHEKKIIFRLDSHLERLKQSCDSFSIKMPFNSSKIKSAILTLIKKSKFKQGYIRPMVYYGVHSLTLNPKEIKTHCMITVWPWKKYHGEKLLKTAISPYIRPHPKSVKIEAKMSGYYCNSILATMDAQKKGYDEAILLDYEGNIAEGSVENIFIVKNKKVYTPALGSILPGITRDSIIQIIKEKKRPLHEKKISLKELLNCDEAFFSGTACEIAPIASINGKKIRDGKVGPITASLRIIFYDIVHGKNKKYIKWVEFV